MQSRLCRWNCCLLKLPQQLRTALSDLHGNPVIHPCEETGHGHIQGGDQPQSIS